VSTGGCKTTSLSNVVRSNGSYNHNPTGASCPVGDVSPIPATWQQYAALCVSRAASLCDPALCPSALPTEFQQRRCIYQGVEAPCPSGGYSERFLMYEDIDDQRDCSCACSASGLTCNAGVQLYGGSGCTGGSSYVAFNMQCYSPQMTTVASYEMLVTGPNGVCSPTGGGVTGTATPVDPVTVCCEP
jgi:hypothetical protein